MFRFIFLIATIFCATTAQAEVTNTAENGFTGGFLFHGRVKALAEAAREGGLEF